MENNSEQFDDISPLHSSEVSEAIEHLLAEPRFVGLLSFMFSKMPIDDLKKILRSVTDADDFQLKLMYPLLMDLQAKTSHGIILQGAENVDKSENYLYISNHRDIVLDSAYLCVRLVDEGMKTVEIGIGDNLLIYPWIEQFVRLNKSFIVRRGVSGRTQLMASQHLSDYIRFALHEKHQSVWLAQREGRAKDGNDRTQESILKMLNMSGTAGIRENISSFNICPLSISYEYDPCDFLKAKEFQQKRDDPEFKKSPGDDLTSMQTGIMGFKGKVVYKLAGNIAQQVLAMPVLPRGEQFSAIAQLIDKLIYSNYVIFDTNRIAYDILNPGQQVGGYTAEAKDAFETYLAGRIAKVDLPNKDEDFLRFKLLEMYANPLVNQLSTI